MNKLTVGQKLWYVPNYGVPKWVSVSKIGRKWAYIDDLRMRIDIETLTPGSGGYSPSAQFHLDKDEYEKKKELGQEWQKFIYIVRNSCLPAGITIDDIKQAMNLLKLKDI